MRQFLVSLALLASVQTAGGEMSQVPAGVTRTQLVDNSSVLVARLKFEPGAAEQIHTHPFSAVVIQLTPGDVQMTIGSEKTSERREAGFAWFIPTGAPHAAVNVGTNACEFVTVAIKPGSHSSNSAPPTPPVPSGVTRTPVLENDQARVVKVAFAPGSREAVHSHAFDLLIIQLSSGRVETQLGTGKTVSEFGPGEVQFLPKDVPHAVANAGSTGFDLMSVGVK